jgi:hypothetical protein
LAVVACGSRLTSAASMTCRDSLTSIPTGSSGSITVSGVATRWANQRHTGTDPEPERYHEWIRFLGAGRGPVTGVVLVAEAGGQILACCQMQRRDGYVHFGMFAVSPGQRGGGLGEPC